MGVIFLVFLLLASILLYLSENNSKTGPFVVGMFFVFYAICDFLFFNSFASIEFSLCIFFTIYTISNIKFQNLRSSLNYNDMFEFDARAWADAYKSSKGAFLFFALCMLLFLSVTAAFIFWMPPYEAHFGIKLALALAGLGLVFRFKKRALKDIQFWNVDSRHISTFLVQMVDQKFLPQSFRHLEVPHVDPADLDHELGDAADKPNIILISQESTIPPQMYGLPAEPDIVAFFQGAEHVRKLKVEVFGGQTIISILSALTGLPSSIFGRYRVYAPRLWRDRIKVSLPFFVKQFGYRTAYFVTAESEWMNVGSFYKSIGIDSLFEPSEFTGGRHLDLMQKRDSIVLDAALNHLEDRVMKHDDTCFVAIETLGNHAPFNRDIYPDDKRVQQTKAWFAKETSGKPGPDVCEYMGRLRASVDDYNAFKSGLETRCKGKKFVIVHFGDHQPVWANTYFKAAGDKHFLTYFTVDYVGFDEIPETPSWPDVMPIFNLDLFVASRAGLPLNGYLKQKAWMLNEAEHEGFGIHNPLFHAAISGLRHLGLIVEDKKRR